MTQKQKQEATQEKKGMKALKKPPSSEVPNAASKSAAVGDGCSMQKQQHQTAVTSAAAAAAAAADAAADAAAGAAADAAVGRLGLWHFINRICRTLRENHPDFGKAIAMLQAAIYRIDALDEAAVMQALFDGTLNGTKMSWAEINELRGTAHNLPNNKIRCTST
jgi:hypothetical protein